MTEGPDLAPDPDESSPFPETAYLDVVTVYNPDPDRRDHFARLAGQFAVQITDQTLVPLRRVLEIARANGCRSVVVEHRYTDADYASEFVHSWAGRHEPLGRETQRVHFFDVELTADDVHELPEPALSGYLGYMVLRPTEVGPVGRTVLKPPPEANGAILCEVADRPSLFGNDLEIRGVPFMQQDGELLRCAHVAAWLCHYVASERNVIGRHLTATLATHADAGKSPDRARPSNGLTSAQLQAIFGATGTPAAFYSIEALPEPPAPWPAPEAPPSATGRRGRKARAQHEDACERHQTELQRERLERVICKHLNSGFPVIVQTRGQPENHAFVLVGWKQEGDRVRFFACDDRIGPYEPIDVLADSDMRGAWVGMMVPLPDDVMLTGEAAETRARNAVRLGAARPKSTSLHDKDFEVLAPQLETLRGGEVSIRARLMLGRDFKRRIGRQGRTAEALKLLRGVPLSRWVWLVELQSRSARAANEPCVLAEFVFDSTSQSKLPQALTSATLNEVKDVARVRAQEMSPECLAPGTGAPWPSLINPPRRRPALKQVA